MNLNQWLISRQMMMRYLHEFDADALTDMVVAVAAVVAAVLVAFVLGLGKVVIGMRLVLFLVYLMQMKQVLQHFHLQSSLKRQLLLID